MRNRKRAGVLAGIGTKALSGVLALTLTGALLSGCGKDAEEAATIRDSTVSATQDNPEDAVAEIAFDDTEAAQAGIYVEKVKNLPEDFYFGVDISSYLAERNSGVVYKDMEGNELDDAGFMNLLKEGGVNLVRLRLWNDPYDEEGHPYGGGNCDLETVQTIGKLASDAGLQVLIDFHYSDFWADPRKQQAPKAWKSLNVEKRIDAVHDYTKESLETLIDAGVDVVMVQIGNETTTGLMGEKSYNRMAKYMSAGSQAVREAATDKNRDILVALHFCNVEQGKYSEYAQAMYENGVDYDIFGSSYYPYWHGSLQHLTAELTNVARDYGKKVMVLETSYSRTFEDGDGSGNTESESKIGVDTFDYDISVQGQADAVRDVVNAVVQVGKSTRDENTRAAGIGVCYWEPAWIPVHVWKEGAENADEVLARNEEAWETYGSGWATSYSGAYDEDAAKYYGGSAVDNEAWFDFDGTALDTVNIFRYCRTGAVTDQKITKVSAREPVTLNMEEAASYTLPETATVTYNDRTTKEVRVDWTEIRTKKGESTSAAVQDGKLQIQAPGEYDVTGTLLTEEDAEATQETVTLHVTVQADNMLPDGDFEGIKQNGISLWMMEGEPESCASVQNDQSNNRTGEYTLHYWDQGAFSFDAYQHLELEAGTYTYGGYVEGETLGDGSVLLYMQQSGSNEEIVQTAELSGWKNWENPELTFTVPADGTGVVLGMRVDAGGGSWGSFDDMYLNKIE